MLLLLGAKLTRPARAERGESLSRPVGKRGRGYSSLEAHPEAGFRLQREVVAITRLESPPWVTVGQPPQVFEPLARNPNTPQQADVKVGVEGPHPETPEFVDLGLAN